MNPPDFRADLHCHTTCSDGTDTPEEIIQLAEKKGLQGLAITDHDTVQAYEGLLQKNSSPIQLVSGVELSASLLGESVHLLAYGFRLDHPELVAFCQRHHERRLLRGKAILKRLEAEGIRLEKEEVLSLSRSSMGRPHIAQVLMKHGYVQSISEAFKKYIGKGKVCYVPSEAFSAEETLDVIRKIKGLAVIAHPHLIPNRNVVEALLTMPFDGIECYYARFRHEDEKKWLSIANKKDWLITGGSDYHGTVKPQISLGCSWVGEETFSILRKHFETNSSEK